VKTVIMILLVIGIIAVCAGIVVVHRQGLEACVTYYTKDGTRQLNKECR
jgi:hypothetical protein